MRLATNAMRQTNEEGADQAPKPFTDSRAELIHQLFPHLSLLEKFVLSTVLDREHVEKLVDRPDPSHLRETPIAQGVRQYIEYLSQKDQWEKRQLTDNVRPISIYRARHLE